MGDGKQVQQFLLVGEVRTLPMAHKHSFLNELPIHQLAGVTIPEGRTAEFTLKPVAVTGRLEFNVVKVEGKAILVYRIVADTVEPVAPRDGFGPSITGGC